MPLASDLSKIGFSSHDADFLGDTQTDSITLTGTTQGTGYAITSSINRITGGTAASAEAATLPKASTFKGSYIAIRSDNIAFSAQIFPAVDDAINGLAANAAYALSAGTGALFLKVSSTRWVTVP
jgi:hypothetical protein